MIATVPACTSSPTSGPTKVAPSSRRDCRSTTIWDSPATWSRSSPTPDAAEVGTREVTTS